MRNRYGTSLKKERERERESESERRAGTPPPRRCKTQRRARTRALKTCSFSLSRALARSPSSAGICDPERALMIIRFVRREREKERQGDTRPQRWKTAFRAYVSTKSALRNNLRLRVLHFQSAYVCQPPAPLQRSPRAKAFSSFG